MVANAILTSSFLLGFFSVQVHVIPLSLYFFSGHWLAGGDVSEGGHDGSCPGDAVAVAVLMESWT